MKQFLLMSLILIACLLIVAVLFLSSGMNSDRKNGFYRVFKSGVLTELKVLDVKYNSFYISGLDAKYFYLGNSAAPLNSIKSSYDLIDTVHTRLPFSFSDQVMWGKARLQVDSPYIYMNDDLSATVISATMPFKDEKTYRLIQVGFDDLKVISNTSLIARSYDNTKAQKVLNKIVFHSNEYQGLSYIPLMQQEGIFSIDGFITYNKQQAKIFYTFYYRNEFACLDTNLALIYKGNTIDTNSVAKIDIKSFLAKGKKNYIHAKPPLLVNKRAFSDGDYLFINADLPADNENREQFGQYDVIDIYNINEGKYSYSLRLASYLNKKLKDFAIRGDNLIALYDHYVVSFKLDL